MNFNECLKKARETAGISQKQLADKLNVPASMISRYESTDTEPRIGFVLKIIEILGTTPNVFFNYETEYKPVELKQLLKEFRIANNFTLEQMAQKLNVLCNDYQDFENGTKLPCLKNANNIYQLTTGDTLNYLTSNLITPFVYSNLIAENIKIMPKAFFDINEKNNNIIFCYPSLNFVVEIKNEKDFTTLKSTAYDKAKKIFDKLNKQIYLNSLIETIGEYAKTHKQQ